MAANEEKRIRGDSSVSNASTITLPVAHPPEYKNTNYTPEKQYKTDVLKAAGGLVEFTFYIDIETNAIDKVQILVYTSGGGLTIEIMNLERAKGEVALMRQDIQDEFNAKLESFKQQGILGGGRRKKRTKRRDKTARRRGGKARRSGTYRRRN